MNNHEIVISSEVTLAVNLDGTAMFPSPFPSGGFDTVLTGPPGGPLSFLVWRPAPEERAVGGMEVSVRRLFRLPAGPLAMKNTARIILAGAERDALSFLELGGFASTGWCVVRIEEGPAVVFVAFGCSIGKTAVSCEAVLSHPSLSKIAASLRVVT